MPASKNEMTLFSVATYSLFFSVSNVLYMIGASSTYEEIRISPKNSVPAGCKLSLISERYSLKGSPLRMTYEKS